MSRHLLQKCFKFFLIKTPRHWSTTQSKLLMNIFNFAIRYINNTLPACKNLFKWGISSTDDCSFCLQPETLLHVVPGFQHYLERFTWRHDSILNFLEKMFKTIPNGKLFVTIPGFQNPSTITGDEYRPGLLSCTSNNGLYIVQLTVGFKTKNVIRKKKKRQELIKDRKTIFSRNVRKPFHQFTWCIG